VACIIGGLDFNPSPSSWDLQTAMAVQALSRCIGSDMVLSAFTALKSDHERYTAIASGFGVQSVRSTSGIVTLEVCTTCKMVCGLRTLCCHCGTRRGFYTPTHSIAQDGLYQDNPGALECSKQLIIPQTRLHSTLCLQQLESQRCHAISASQQCP